MKFSTSSRLFAALLMSFALFPLLVFAAAWDIEDAVYHSQSSFLVTKSTGVHFKSDGTSMFITGGDNPTFVNQYDLSTAWDITTAAANGSYAPSSDGIYWIKDFFFKTDGSKVYLISSYSDEIHQYSLSSAWTVSTMSDDSVSFDVSTQDTFPGALFFKSDGTKMYMLGDSNDSVFQYSMSSAWDLSTLSYDSVSVSVNPYVYTSEGLFFKDDGTEMYVLGPGSDTVQQFTLSTPWDLSTASADVGTNFSVASRSSQPQALFIGDSGEKMYTCDYTSGRTHRWDLVDSTAPDISSTSPSSGATGVATDANIILYFTESVDAETGDIELYKSDDTLVETFDVTSDISGSGSSTITINPTSDLDELTSYYLLIDATAFDDASSNSFAGLSDTSTYTFTTADETNPTVSSLSPTDDASDVGVDANLVITFTENVDVESGNITIKTTSGDTTVETIDVTGGKVSGTGTNTITVNPATTLDGETEYYVLIDATAFDDASSNSYAGIASTTAWSFTTADVTDPTLSSVSPTDDSTDIPLTGTLTLNFSENVDVESGNITIKKTSDDSSGNSYAGLSDSTAWSFTTLAAVVSSSSEEGGGGYGSAVLAQNNNVRGGSSSSSSVGLSFSDLSSDHSNSSAIEELKDRGVIEGYETGEFKPEKAINRAEFLKILVELRAPEAKGGDYCFYDVTNAWYAQYVCAAEELGWVQGYPDGNFRPARTIELREALKIVVMAFELDHPELQEGQEWYMPYWAVAGEKELLQEIVAVLSDELTRAEMAQLVYNVLEL